MALLGPGPGWSRSRGRGPLALLTRTLLVSAEGAGGGSGGGPPSVQSPPTGAIRPRARWPQAAHRPPRVPSDPVPFSPLLSHPGGTSQSPKNPKMLWDSAKTPHRHLGACHGAWPHLWGIFHQFFNFYKFALLFARVPRAQPKPRERLLERVRGEENWEVWVTPPKLGPSRRSPSFMKLRLFLM